jgi:hypothetical protein
VRLIRETEPLFDGRLPAADSGDGHGGATRKGLRDVFTRMGFDDREIVALSGAHYSVFRSRFWGFKKIPNGKISCQSESALRFSTNQHL